MPHWLSAILKLGRYGIALKALIRLAFECPALFNPIVVEAIPAPAATQFRVIREVTTLKSVL
jgi:hypothetical protein